jgi:hypothetical protein
MTGGDNKVIMKNLSPIYTPAPGVNSILKRHADAPPTYFTRSHVNPDFDETANGYYFSRNVHFHTGVTQGLDHAWLLKLRAYLVRSTSFNSSFITLTPVITDFSLLCPS